MAGLVASRKVPNKILLLYLWRAGRFQVRGSKLCGETEPPPLGRGRQCSAAGRGAKCRRAWARRIRVSSLDARLVFAPLAALFRVAAGAAKFRLLNVVFFSLFRHFHQTLPFFNSTKPLRAERRSGARARLLKNFF